MRLGRHRSSPIKFHKQKKFELKFHIFSDEDGAPWWSGREDFSHSGLGGTHRSGVGDQEERSDVSSGRGDGSDQRRTAQFTEYSITSSVVPRSEGTCTTAD